MRYIRGYLTRVENIRECSTSRNFKQDDVKTSARRQERHDVVWYNECQPRQNEKVRASPHHSSLLRTSVRLHLTHEEGSPTERDANQNHDCVHVCCHASKSLLITHMQKEYNSTSKSLVPDLHGTTKCELVSTMQIMQSAH